jgi:hypothetical protein
MHSLLLNTDIREVLAPVAAADDTDSNSDILDVGDCDGVIFIVPITDSVATGVATLNVQGNTANSDGGMATITGATATVTCAISDDLNDELLIVDVQRPLKRYIQGNVTSATANIAFGNMIAIKYAMKDAPVTAHSSISASTQVVGS